MILWITAFFLMAALGVVGYYQGAVRVAFSLVGLIVAAVLAIPVSFLAKALLPPFGVHHPVVIAFVGPILTYIVILAIFKGAALLVHKKIDTHYRYHASDTQRLLFERLNQRIGICLGLANAGVYLIVLTIIAYLVGYFTVQVSTSDQDGFALRMANKVAKDVQKTGMDKAVAAFVPSATSYYDGVDILGDVFYNPLLQSRLSSYPVFLTLAEKPEFKAIGNDVAFQEFWQKKPRLGELMEHEKIKPIVENVELYTNVVGMLGGDLTDLKTFVETGKSPKYDDEKILGHWDYNLRESLGLARRLNPGMGTQQLRYTRLRLSELQGAKFTATIDNKILLKLPMSNSVANIQGTWSSGSGGKYVMTWKEGDQKLDFPTTVDNNKAVVTRNIARTQFNLVFDK